MSRCGCSAAYHLRHGACKRKVTAPPLKQLLDEWRARPALDNGQVSVENLGRRAVRIVPTEAS